MSKVDYDIDVTSVEAYELSDIDMLIINYNSAIGWGQAVFTFERDGKILVETEKMCNNDNKEFLYQLMKALVDKCEVIG